MVYIYNIGIHLYFLLIYISSLFNKKATNWIKGRKDIFIKIKERVEPGQKIVWFHCSSLGEFEQGRPVIETFKTQHPDFKILLTFFSPSGYEIRKNYNKADYIFYLPLDTKKNAIQFIEIIKPQLVFFVKYEFWFHYLHILNTKKIPVYIFSAIFRPNQVFFKWYGKWYKKILFFFNHLFVQDQQSEELLKKYGLKNVTIAGDTRFDRVHTIASQTLVIPELESFKQNKLILIAGSTWPADESLLLNYINNNSSNEIKYIIAPHEIHSEEINRFCSACNKKTIRFSEIKNKSLHDQEVLIIDNIGMLSSLYKYGNIAYIGGGFGKGIHNTLEAATFGLPIIFGPRYKKFKEAIDLIALKASYSISTYKEFEKCINSLITNNKILISSGTQAAEYVKSRIGGTKIILFKIDQKKL